MYYLVIDKERFEEELKDMFFNLPFRLGDITFGNVGIIIELKNVINLPFSVLDTIESHMEEFESIDLDEIILHLDIYEGNYCLLLTPIPDKCGNDQEFKYKDFLRISKRQIRQYTHVSISYIFKACNCNELVIGLDHTEDFEKIQRVIDTVKDFFLLTSDKIVISSLPKYHIELRFFIGSDKKWILED